MTAPFHTGAWTLWLLAAATPTAVTRNPWYLLLVLAAAAAVQRGLVHDRSRSRTWGGFVRFGLFLGLLTLAFNLLFGGAGETELFSWPRWAWETTWNGREVTLFAVGGPVTAESLVHGAVSACALLAILTVLATFNLLVDHYQLVRRVPRFLDQSATVVSIALAFVPELVRAQREIREALALRGYRFRRLRDLPPLFVALLAEGLERSMTLAESMEARGFRRRREEPGRGGETVLRLAVLLALGLLAGGFYFRADPDLSRVGTLLLAAGSVLLVGVLIRLGRGVRRTRFRRERWRPRDTVVSLASLTALGIFLTLWWTRRSLLVFDVFPRVHWPGLHPLPMAAALLLIAPIVAVRVSRDSSREDVSAP